MRHLENHDLWIQQVIKAGRAIICKINGKQNPADLFTKHLSQNETIIHMAMLGFRLINDKGIELGVKVQAESGNAYQAESRNAYQGDHEESDDEDVDHDQWVNYLEGLFKEVGLVVPIKQVEDVLVDQKEIPVDVAPLNQVDSAAGRNEPRQDSDLSIETTAQSSDHPSITSTTSNPSWVTVVKKTSTNIGSATGSSTRSTSAKAVQSKVEIPITAKTYVTSQDFGRLFKIVEDLGKKVAGTGYVTQTAT